MRPYIVRPGDYTTRIASRAGLDPAQLWDDPSNLELRRTRPHREMLAPGDILQLPDPPARREQIVAGNEHRFAADLETVRVRVLVLDGGTPVIGEPWNAKAEFYSWRQHNTTSDEGHIEMYVPLDVRWIVVRMPRRRHSFRVLVGDLHPPTTPSGVRQRLYVLGFLGSPETPSDERAGAWRLARAVSEFQSHHQPNAANEDEAAFQTRLAEVFGA